MIKVREITVYACKSNRKNSQCVSRTYKVYRGADNIKKKFTSDDIADFKQWLSLQEFKNFYMVVYTDNVCLHLFNSNRHYSEFQVIRIFEEFAKLFNNEVEVG